MPKHFQSYYITDRRQLKSYDLAVVVAEAIAAGVDWVQIREKDLPARAMLALTKTAVELAGRQGHTRVIVNDRLDVALAAAAHGVHLGTRSMPLALVRRLAPRGFIVGVSCHSRQDVLAAEKGGADYALLGPIFPTPSKLPYGPPLGLAALRDATSQATIPVLALGGISQDRLTLCAQNGAAGVAGIRIFQDCASMKELMRVWRAAAR